MMLFGRLQGSLLVICVVGLALLFFVGGFTAAVFLGGMDTATATAVAGTVVNRSEYLGRMRNNTMNTATRMARRPLFTLSSFAARPVQDFYKKIPGSLKPLSPQRALDETLAARKSDADTAIQNSAVGSEGIQGRIRSATTVNVPAGGPAATGATTAGADAAATSTAEAAPAAASPAAAPAAGSAPAAVAATPVPEVPRRVLAPPVPAAGGGYAIELASFRQSDTANAFIAEMQRRKLMVALVDELDASGREWHHVRLGPYPTQEQAAIRLTELRQTQNLPGVIVQEPAAEKKS